MAKKLQKCNRRYTSFGTHSTCWIWKCILRGFSPQISTDFNTNLKHLEKVVSQEGLTRKLSVIRQKDESQNGCFKKTKHVKFSEKRTFLTAWYNTFWESPFCLITDDIPPVNMKALLLVINDPWYIKYSNSFNIHKKSWNKCALLVIITMVLWQRMHLGMMWSIWWISGMPWNAYDKLNYTPCLAC